VKRVAIMVLAVIALVGALAPLIANDVPVMASVYTPAGRAMGDPVCRGWGRPAQRYGRPAGRPHVFGVSVCSE